VSPPDSQHGSPSNEQLPPTLKDNQERRAKGDKRQRTSDSCYPVSGNGSYSPTDQQKGRRQQDQSEASLTADQLPGKIVDIGAEPSTTAQSPLVSEDSLAWLSRPAVTFKSLADDLRRPSADKKGFQKPLAGRREVPSGKPVAGIVEQAPLGQRLGRKRKFAVWKDVPQLIKPTTSKLTAQTPLQDVTNIQNRLPPRRGALMRSSKKPRFRVEGGDYHHPNLRGFKFPQGAVSSETATGEQIKSTKRKAEDELRVGAAKRQELPDDQPSALVVGGTIQSSAVQDSTSACFTEYAQPLPTTPLEDVVKKTSPDQKYPEEDKDLEVAEAQQVPVTILEPISNDESTPPVNDTEIQLNEVQVLENETPASSITRPSSPDLETPFDGLSQGLESPDSDEPGSPVFGTYRSPSPAPKPAAATEEAPQAAPVIVSTVPTWIVQNSQYTIAMDMAYLEGYSPEQPQDYKHHLAQFTARPAVPRSREREYRPMPKMLDVETLNQRLNWVIPVDGEAPPHLFREMPIPPYHIDSELARCVRFAQSDAQRRVDWRAHPSHVAEIIQRTNFYGMELLIGRSEMRISSPPTADEFELVMAARIAHASFGKDQVDYIAADVPALSDYLSENLPSAMCIFLNEDEDHFSCYTDYYRARFAEEYPPLGVLELPAWRALLDGERGQPSLKAQSLQQIIESITAQASQPLGDAGRTPLPTDDLWYKDLELSNVGIDGYNLDPGHIHGLGGDDFGGGFRWNDTDTNESVLNANQNEALHYESATLITSWYNGETAQRFPDPIVPKADAGASDLNVDFDPESWFWTDLDMPLPWGFGQDDNSAEADGELSRMPGS
jgi:hypothetical protein